VGKLRILSGQEVCAILQRHGFREVRRRSSHIMMQRRTASGTTTVPVPGHTVVRIGTLRSFAETATRTITWNISGHTRSTSKRNAIRYLFSMVDTVKDDRR
jgi:predicted RNA binding protein YcfA (HicA-like mRNA interferase family)